MAHKAQYPEREPFFAQKVARLVFKDCVAQHFGANTALLVICVAGQEDSVRYRRPVTFYNGQLLHQLGLGSVERLNAARKKAISAGWLHYEPGTKSKPGTYWVTIPDSLKDVPDTPTEEGCADESPDVHAESQRNPEINPNGMCGSIPTESVVQCQRDPNGIRSAMPTTSADLPYPIPIPIKEIPPNPQRGNGGFDSDLGDMGNPRKPRRQRVEFANSDVPLPAELETAEVRAAIDQWLDYRKRKKKPYTSAADFALGLKRFARHGPRILVDSIEYSIGNNYTGIANPWESKYATTNANKPADPTRPQSADQSALVAKLEAANRH